MNSLITINDHGLVSARELHEFLEVKTKFTDWMLNKVKKYGFVEDEDFILVSEKKETNNPKNPYTEITDYAITIDMSKELSMVENNLKGKEARKYFIQVEKAWNSPEMIMKRALEIANKQVEKLNLENAQKNKVIEEQKPKVIFADAVSASHTSILIGELAKILKQNGVDTGQNKFFQWLRDNGYLIKRKGTDYNMPTQRSMDQGLFEIKETSVSHSDGHISISKTPKVTGKGQQYFINKFLQEQSIEEIACIK